VGRDVRFSQVRVTADEQHLVEKAAERCGLPIAAFIRVAALAAARTVLGSDEVLGVEEVEAPMPWEAAR
jgi:uncharacterized protein (DUF1778 family)